MKTIFNLRLSLFAGLLTLSISLSSFGQVRYAPDGNSLPGRTDQPTNPSSNLEMLPTPTGEKRTAAIASDKSVDQAHHRFASEVDLSAFKKLAVFEGGRAKILDTLAREHLTRVYGKPRWKDLHPGEAGGSYDPVFTYLDLLFNKSYYYDKPLIYVEVLGLRRSLLSILPFEEQDRWLRGGRLTPRMLSGSKIQKIIAGLERDLTMQKAIRQVSMSLFAFENTGRGLRMISPTGEGQPWAYIQELQPLAGGSSMGNSGGISGGTSGGGLVRVGLTDGLTTHQDHQPVVAAFARLSDGWGRMDAGAVNTALGELSKLIPRMHPETYPSTRIRDVEYLYNATHRFTIGHWAYFLGMIVLLIAFGTGRRWLIGLGISFVGIGFIVHTLGIATRGVLAGRWPIHNQFESFMAICWFATLVGIVMMLVRKQWLFGAAAAALSGCGLLLANTYPIPSQEVGQVAGILQTSRILYLHVNMVLFSYGLIALGFFVSLFYLGMYYLRGRGSVRFAAAGLGQVDVTGGEDEGGFGGDSGRVSGGRLRVLGDLDKAQMVVLQLAFWVLGFGVLLGAYWADHAWGRWWAWDPKETWALITWIIYLIVIHVRFAAKNRGLVTAWLSAVGFIVMLWTYWGVNLVLAGLHSYA